MPHLADAPLRPRGDRPRQIVAEARRLLEAEGAEALTVRRLAAALGIRAPSLYKHFPDKETLEAAVIAQGFEEQADAFEAALIGAEDPLGALAHAYRAFALAHPHLYRLMTGRPLRRDRLPAGLEERAGRPVFRVAGGDLGRARALWGLAHGLVDLELNGRFPPDADVDAAWRAGLVAFADAGATADAYPAS
jgi:AcrR family transcriptional regulator